MGCGGVCLNARTMSLLVKNCPVLPQDVLLLYRSSRLEHCAELVACLEMLPSCEVLLVVPAFTLSHTMPLNSAIPVTECGDLSGGSLGLCSSYLLWHIPGIYSPTIFRAHDPRIFITKICGVEVKESEISALAAGKVHDRLLISISPGHWTSV